MKISNRDGNSKMNDQAKKDTATENIVIQNKPHKEFPPDFDPVTYSWEFLTKITEFVFTKLNDQQQKDILRIGIALLNSGAVYQHVIYNADKGNGKKK